MQRLATINFVIFVTQVQVLCHPQCLDFRAPFKPGRGLFYCKSYRDFTCCTKDDDLRLYRKYYDIQSRVNYRNSRKCGNLLRQILCLKCDPYAAHIYDSENKPQNPLKFPGLCPAFCNHFYKECHHLIQHLTNDSALLSSNTSDRFCATLELSDPDYCYPNLLINENIYGRLRKSRSYAKNCLCVEEVASGLRNPVFGKWEKMGEPFLNISDRVRVTPRLADERGLLGLAFHPLFDTNNRFYIYYTGKNYKGYTEIRISEFKALSTKKGSDKNEIILMALEKPNNYWNHNDGMLYIFTGDGGGAGDPMNLAQNMSSLFGKALRIDVTAGATATRNYSIPYSNPFISKSDAMPEIYAMGLRNSWRCSIDRGEYATGTNRGRIICGDVGQDAFEEINLIEKGNNYGWNAKEAFQCFNQETCQIISDDALPIHAYSHKIGKSVTGGYIYRGCLNANLKGSYIYADYMNGKLFQLKEDSNGAWHNHNLTMCADELCKNGLENNYHKNVLSFAEDYQGEIYMLSTSEPSTSSREGTIYRLIDPRRREDPSTCKHSLPI